MFDFNDGELELAERCADACKEIVKYAGREACISMTEEVVERAERYAATLNTIGDTVGDGVWASMTEDDIEMAVRYAAALRTINEHHATSERDSAIAV